MLDEAFAFALQAHRGQVRKTETPGPGIPYIVHPIAVARLLLEAGASVELAAAGVLHDTVEDTEVELADIEQRFGPRVAELVGLASEPPKDRSWEERKQAMLDALRATTDLDFVRLFCADKLDNLAQLARDLEREGEAVFDRFKRARAQQEWYSRALFDIFRERLGDQDLMVRAYHELESRVYGL